MQILSLVTQLAVIATCSDVYSPMTAVSIDGTLFCINGELTYGALNPDAHGLFMNVRMVNSTFEDENPETCPDGFDPEANTDAFIASMDEYKAKGILAFTLNLQGGMPGYENALNSAFCPDGSLKEAYMTRVARTIEAADARGMVIILGFFYQRQDQVLKDEDAVRQATANAASWVRDQGYTNVMIEIANEYNHPGFDHAILLGEEGEAELMDLVRTVAPNLLVSTSGLGNGRFHRILAEEADFIIIHGNTTEPEDYAGRVESLEPYSKPIVFNEDWCFSDDPRGMDDATIKAQEAFVNGASWGIMNQQRNQYWPFVFGIGKPEEDQNAKEDFLAYEKIAELVGVE